MNRSPFEDPARDPRLAEALRRVETPLSAEGDDALRARIVWEARGRLAARRLAPRPRPWWAWTAQWARVALPVGVAASVAAGALVLRTPIGAAGGETAGTDAGAELALDDAGGVGADTVAMSYVLLSDAAGGAGAAGGIADHVLGTGPGDWLLDDPTTESR